MAEVGIIHIRFPKQEALKQENKAQFLKLSV